ncbi:MAG: hypothetical protein ACM3O6_00015, partial [Acidobacteriota bacterium]
IACDAVCEIQPAIETAAQLAGQWQAALHGIFVEDLDLLQAAALPFTREVSAAPAAAQALDEAEMALHLSALASRVRSDLEAVARRYGLVWSFAVVRDRPSARMLSAPDADLLIVEGRARPFAGGLRLESRFVAAAFDADRSVLLLRDGGEKRGRVVALVQSAGETGWRTLAAAAKVAAAGDRSLTVLVATDEVSSAEIRDRLRSASPELAAHVRIESASRTSVANLGRDLLVVDADPAVNPPSALREIVASTPADVLLVR